MRIIIFPLLACVYSCLLPGSHGGATDEGGFSESNFVNYHKTIAGSPTLLKRLAAKEEVIYVLVQDYYGRLVNLGWDESLPIVQLIENYVHHFDTTTGLLKLNITQAGDTASYRPNNVAWNPISTYHLLKRFLGSLKELVRELRPDLEDELALQRQILDVMSDIGWPPQSDLTQIMSSILRLEYVYDLNTDDIATGILDGTDLGIYLSASDCNAIGMQALKDGQYALAVEWLQAAQRKQYYVPLYEIGNFVKRTQLEKNLQIAIGTHDREYDLQPGWDARFFVHKALDVPVDKVRRRTTELKAWKGGRTANLNEINYWGVCSGENYKSEAEKSKLVCWYEREAHVYWKINPLKAELLSIEPIQIVQYYGMIGDQMIQKIKNDAGPRLAPSVVFEGTSLIQSHIRTSMNTWIKDHIEPRFMGVPRIIELVTGMTVHRETSAEELQVACYSSGSHYNVHLDAFDDPLIIKPSGNRIATFIYYLADVGKGGGTAFPQSGIATTPTKGSAILWYNINRKGVVNPYSWHGSCPVILGEKWIANKWMHSNDQMFSPQHKCLPGPESTFEINMNGKPVSLL